MPLTPARRAQQLARLAAWAQQRLAPRPLPGCSVALPVAIWQDCRAQLARWQRAQQRGWAHGSASAQEALRAALARLLRDVEGLAARVDPPPRPPRSTPRELFDDLVSLDAEYPDRLSWSRREARISLTTEPIVLEGIDLGSFRIDLYLLVSHESPHYRVVALQPQPAAHHDHVTHPHVQSEQLCEGAGRAAIAAALAGGRLYDFFQLVERVLASYNPTSPFVALEHWHGSSCADCGAALDAGEAYACRQCGDELCDECQRPCHDCQDALCSQCGASCARCDAPLCPGCQQACAACAAACCSDCFHSASERCNRCEDESEDGGAEGAGPGLAL